ncbi:phage tail protein [Rhodococcus hoagii]|nr:phage tail protein [Prescottella equi]NKR79460.1 phage tail protein [Prescottella equi]NKT01857.1 phage tail protein [Prescottella equi]
MGAAPTVELEGVNGQMFTLSGPGAGAEGVKLGTNIQGLYDAPVKTIYNSHAFEEGSTYGGKRILQRDITFGVNVLGAAGTWEDLDSAWRLAFDYGRTARLWVQTESSRRYLDVALAKEPEVVDPFKGHANGYTQVVMQCVAADPWWYDNAETFSWVSPTDTTDGSTVNGTIAVPYANPTPNPIWPQWVVQGTLGARWTVPDYSFGDDRKRRAAADADRRIMLPLLLAGEHLYIDADEGAKHEPVRSSLDTQIYLRMNGVSFIYPIRAGQKQTNFNVSVSKAPAGVGIQLRLIRPYPRPWGLRL